MADGKILIKLQKLTDLLAKDFSFEELFRGVMSAYGTSKSYINGALDNNPAYNIAKAPLNANMVRKDIAMKKRVYFRFVNNDDVARDELYEILKLDIVQKKSNDIPFVIVASSNFLYMYNRINDEFETIDIQDLPSFYSFLLPLTGEHTKVQIKSEHAADVRACVKLTRLLESLANCNNIADNELHSLNDFIRRVLFCLFAEDTGIFEKEDLFSSTFASLTANDGSDCEQFFEDLFLVLNTAEDKRDQIDRPIAREILAFPYVNGGLFKEKSFIPHFNKKTRNQLIDCGSLCWKDTSPAIFGAMFQNAMDVDKRRNMGAHYTSEENILKLIKPLFLDDLYAEFDEIDGLVKESTKRTRFMALQNKIASLKFLDPACGCGNFLIITYRELRRLENLILERLFVNEFVLLQDAIKVNINNFYGIEIEDWPAEIAHISMWLMEHVMNQETALKFGTAIPSIPLKSSATIKCANALTTDWNDVIKASECNYIIGNPPFGGAVTTNNKQKEELKSVYPNKYKLNRVDYVSAWFVKASRYMLDNKNIHSAFVSTNSICQGQQVDILWELLLQNGIHINFAYTSFPWTNAATNAATVTCIIVGFSYEKTKQAKLFIYDKGNITQKIVKAISPYLIEENTNTIIVSMSNSLSSIKDLKIGNMPNDEGNLLLSYEEGQDLIKQDHAAVKFLKKFMGSDELINGYHRYCLWLTEEQKEEWEKIDFINSRLEKIQAFRQKSTRAGTVRLAKTPWRMESNINPDTALVIPLTSSERRLYIPMLFIKNDTIISNLSYILPQADYFDFAILTSRMHMIWMRLTAGKLKTDYRYSRDLTYNTFVWPKIDEVQKQKLTDSAKNILKARYYSKINSLAELYNPETMPEDLYNAHIQNDALVESLYRDKPFESDEERLSFLLGLYNKRITELKKQGVIKEKEWKL